MTLQWVTDFPKFNIVLYQNLGENYGDFASAYLLGKFSSLRSTQFEESHIFSRLWAMAVTDMQQRKHLA